MSTTQMGINHRRRVVYAALKDNIVDPEKVREYFQLWDREFAKDPHFVVTRFTARVAVTAKLSDAQKSALLRSLYLGVARRYADLPKYPESWVSELAEVAPAESAVVSAKPAIPSQQHNPQTVITHAVLEAICDPVRSKMSATPALLKQVADEIFAESVSDPAVLKALKLWAEAGLTKARMPLLYGATQPRTAVHAVYLLAADLLGPMQADRLLSAGIQRAEQLPEAAEFSPQALLH